jgi:hypothetical protein
MTTVISQLANLPSRTIGATIAGLLLGFAAAYVAHKPLTLGQVVIVAGFGTVLLCKALFFRRVST